ncbi:MAG: methyltransferase domain-containing protein [Candidatus Brocadiia bacterium]
MSKLSVVLPAHAEGAELLRRTLESYALQTTPRDAFEVVVADDGGLTDQVLRVAGGDSWPFPIRYVLSPRAGDYQVAHKNHARNTGWQAAAAPVCFICDCDCLVGPTFVAEMLRAWDRAVAEHGPLLCAYPMIACLDRTHIDWLDKAQWFGAGDEFRRFLSTGPVSSHPFGGHYAPEKLRRGQLFSVLDSHPEGFQVLPKQLLADLGGFDEEFIGWGGNKQEFQDRLNELPNVREVLLHHCAVYHQPHAQRSRDHKAMDGGALLSRRRSERGTSPLWKRTGRRIMARSLSRDSDDNITSGALRAWMHDGAATLERFSEEEKDLTIIRRLLRGSPDDSRPIVFFGPWIGEFGWEVARWQGGVRRLARVKGGQCRIVIAGDPGHHPFYECADEYWWTPGFFRAQTFTRDCEGIRPHNERKRYLRAIRGVLARELQLSGQVSEIIAPRRFTPAEQDHIRLEPSEAAVAYRSQLIERGDIDPDYACIFPRRRALNPHKNWGSENWGRLSRYLAEECGLSVVVLGGESDSEQLGPPAYGRLLRLSADRKLDVNIAMLKGAQFAVGSEGGGLFLSLLCGTPTFMFGHEVWQTRLTEEENFLQTPCFYLARPDNRHTYSEVSAALGEFIGEHHRSPVAKGRTGREPRRLAKRVEERLEPDRVIARLTGLPHKDAADLEAEWFASPDYYPYYAAVTSVVRPRRVLEVGTRLGYSLVAMWAGFPGIQRIVAVDDESDVTGSQSMAEMNLRSVGFEGESEPLLSDSLEALDALEAYERFDLIHLDADVRKERVGRALRSAWALLAAGGYLLVDDVNHTEPVGEAFRGAAFRDGEGSEVLPTIRGLGVLRKGQEPVGAVQDAPPCVLCGEATAPVGMKERKALWRCEQCGLVQLSFLDESARAEWERPYREGGRYHRERQMAGYASFIHRYLHDRSLARLRMENIIRYCRMGRLLDVGCSNGALVRAAQEYGFEAEGIDSDPWVAERAARMTGCGIEGCPLVEFVSESKYDVVTLIDTLEHLIQPHESLHKVRSILQSGGLLVIEMPDADQPGFRRLELQWKHVKPGEHAYYFGHGHLEGLLADTGFRLVDTIVPYPDRRIYYARKA